MVQETRLLHTEPSEDAGTTGNAAVGGDSEDDDNFFTFETAQMTVHQQRKRCRALRSGGAVWQNDFFSLKCAFQSANRRRGLRTVT
ncbi:hypothetical protein N1851_026930 [Merluccius polli]|uniref:Uncharacterized protein n=1 Tax=Merluccius polli TaxID=89951 RepID=A0AA47NTU1_MERPO|nr:hypothetical protein N1851_026930 [Merluccius polli]